eukprot:2712084-Pyramimonas_sp.AAC.1
MAHKFLDELVTLSIELERVLPASGTHSELCSPYRDSVCRYLNTYKTEAVDYFLGSGANGQSRVANPAFYHRFVEMVRSDVGGPLCAELA